MLSLEFQGSNFMGVVGKWGADQLDVTIVNVYAPYDLRGKRVLRGEIANLMEVRGW